MFDLLPTLSRTCEGVSRRDFLRIGALTGLGVTLPLALASKAAAKDSRKTKDVNCILIWTLGGTSHHDTFDPKPDAPASVRGEFGVIRTAVPGVQFTEVCPLMARALNRYALLRSWNPRNGSHGAADYELMSGHKFNPNFVYPCYGSIVSQQRGFKTKLPPFVQLGSYVDRTFGGGSAGYLGIEHNPFEIIADPNVEKFSARDITPPAGIDAQRISRRRAMLSRIDALQRQADLQPAAFDALDRHYQAALNLITAPETKKAFEIGSEDPRLRDRYGRNFFGQRCLLARRLIEAGVRFVTVTDPSWDSHQSVFPSLKNSLMPRLDRGVPALLTDLEDRGLLDTTLVVWLTDFGRTPKINSASGRDHWATAGFVVMAGAGVQGGLVIGSTDEEGAVPASSEYHTENVAATIYSKLGLPLDLTVQISDGRPIRLIEGEPIREWA